MDDGLIDRDAVLHVSGGGVNLLAKRLTPQRHLDGSRAAVEWDLLVIDGQVHLAKRAVLMRTDGVRFTADRNLGPVTRLVILILLLGDGLDLRRLCLCLECFPYGCGAVGELDLL